MAKKYILDSDNSEQDIYETILPIITLQ